MEELPVEAGLINRVRSCRKCQWFWGEIPPYGNFPVFDWKEEFPIEFSQQQQTVQEDLVKPGVLGRLCGSGQIDPGVLHGCRKAPIMTIGINPNMTSYFSSFKGAQWAYPNFSRDSQYAYYYRYHNVYQESIDINLIKDNLIDESKVIAQDDGEILRIERGSDHRWALITLKYDNTDSNQEIEVSWSHKARFVVTVKSYFHKGDVIAGKLKDINEDNVRLYENSTTYYQRFVHVLDRFKNQVGKPLSKAKLSISEDVSQHDMVACASPGWSSKYDIPREKILHNCAFDQAWLLFQLIQSSPKVIVIVGKSSLEMFGSLLAEYMPDFNFYDEDRDAKGTPTKSVKEVYQLLKETTERECFLNIDIDGLKLKSRIVVTPHFSYSSNYKAQSRLSKEAWKAFELDFEEDASLLASQDRVKDNTWNNYVPIEITKDKDPIEKRISKAAWSVLMSYYYEPYEMLSALLIQEYKAKRLEYDDLTGRLKRTEGSCHFCNNDLWQFPDSCVYGKDKGSYHTLRSLAPVIKKITGTI